MNLAFRLEQGGAPVQKRLPGSLTVNRRLSQWLTVDPTGFIEARSGKVEIGQGILTALAQIVAAELDVAFQRVRMVPAVTGTSPDEAVTSGSLSIQESGTALRHAAAEVRALLLDEAARRLGVEAGRLGVRDGAILRDGVAAGLAYWDLAGAVPLDREASGAVAPKAAQHFPEGVTVARADLADKVRGRPRYLHDLEWPDMLHGRVLQPPEPGASIGSVDLAPVRAMPGVLDVAQDGSFVGVVAQSAREAEAALGVLAQQVRWTAGRELPVEQGLADWLTRQPVESAVVDERGTAAVQTPLRNVSAEYFRPYLAHASLAPSCAIACWDAARSQLEVWSHSQGIYNLRTDLALAFGLDPARVVVHHAEGAGCYGHNGADDVAFDAAALARACPGRPLRVQWSREDELSVAPFGPAMRVRIEADLDPAGEVVAWRHEVWSNGHGTRPGRAKTPALLAATRLARPFEPLMAVNAPLAAGGGAERNAVPGYDFPAWRIVSHRLLVMPLRTSALRSLGAFANVFAIESFVDDLARAAGIDPLAWRLARVADPRARAVLLEAARLSDWSRRQASDGTGMGLGWARYKNTGAYCAVVAEVVAGREIRVTRLWIAVDVGRVVNPDGVTNQIEGGAIQATSWALKEAVRFDHSQVRSRDWEGYPILRFSEVPRVEVAVLADPAVPSSGAGEAAHGPTVAAIGNAIRDALGVRVRDLPFTPANVAAAI